MRNPTEGLSGTGVAVPGDELESIVARFDEQLADMTVDDRNERHLVADAENRTAAWYDRNVHARTGRPLDPDLRQQVIDLLEQEAPGLVAKRNADQLAGDLTRLEADIGLSGLKLQEERRLRSEIDGLRRDLLRDGHYHREHDEPMTRMAALVRTGHGAWADNHLRVLERYLGRGRWWLR
jgi:hypothetical protein